MQALGKQQYLIGSDQNSAKGPADNTETAGPHAKLPCLCLLVLGMHRSGTSALTRVLNLLGASLPRHVMGAGRGNDAGHWEPERLVAAHDRMLAAIGSCWNDWRALPRGEAERRRLAAYGAELGNLFDEEYGDAPFTVLKDPRICRFVPVYAELLVAKGIGVRYVLSVRNPLAVVSSLRARDGMSSGSASLLWLRHILDAENATRGRPRSLVSYEGLLADWQASVDRIAEQLGLAWPVEPAVARSKINAFLTHKLQHYAPAADDLMRRADIAAWIKGAYEAMLALEKDPNNGESVAMLDDIRSEFDTVASIFAEALQSELAARDKVVEAQGSKIRKHENEIAALGAEKIARDRDMELLIARRELQEANWAVVPQEAPDDRAQSVAHADAITLPMHFFTICARNYLGMAAALQESLAKHHPHSELTVFVLDPGPVLQTVSHLRLRPIHDVMSASDYEKRVCYYDILELATSVKALCFQTLFREGESAVVYLDPDIYLFQPLLQIETAFRDGFTGVLTPHILSPLPSDHAKPDDLAILRSGVYNLGFLALRASSQTDRLLAWWEAKLRWQCFRDPREGVFTDQKWMDLAPIFFTKIRVLRDPTYNVAYWNLPERPLQKSESGAWMIRESPLSFFHFSGFDSANKSVLSRHEDRFKEALGQLAELLAFYTGRLRTFGHHDLSRIAVAQVRFANGVAWDSICRTLYRQRVADGNRELNPLQDQEFLTWIASPRPGQLLPRYVQAVLSLRPDVAAAYPVVAGESQDQLIHWLATSGIRELGIDRALLEALGLISPNMRIPTITYVGYLHAHLGVGEAARGNIKALATAGVPLKLVEVSGNSVSERGPYEIVETFETGPWDSTSDVDLLHVNADQLPLVLHRQAPVLRRPRIGIWAWETEEFPDNLADCFSLVDEVWVSSRFMADAIAPKATWPVQVMPHVISVPKALRCRRDFSLPDDEFIFLLQFDFLSIVHRKNPGAAIAAFRHAFPCNEKVRLVIKTMNANRDPDTLASLRMLASDDRITFWDIALDDIARYALLSSVDCFVSLHRAEGFGLSLAESMAYGKPVIATGWSGNLEFMNITNSILVPYRLEPLAIDHGPYRAGTMWAEADIETAAQAMRRVFEDHDWAASIGARAADSISKQLSPEAIGKRMRDRLQRFAATRAEQRFKGHVPMHPRHAPRLNLLRAALQDAAQNPKLYMRRLPEAWKCYKEHGLTGIRFRLSQKLAGQ